MICRVGQVSVPPLTAAPPSDALGIILRSLLDVGAAPKFPRPVDLVPVTYVRQAMVALMLHARTFSTTYHVVNPSPVPPQLLWVLAQKHHLPLLPIQDWQMHAASFARMHPTHELSPTLAFISPTNGGNATALERALLRPAIDCSETLIGLEGRGIVCPPADALLNRVLGRSSP